jgi:hypothetical protein
MEGALDIVGKAMKRIWKGVILSIQSGWNDLMQGIAKVFKDNPWLLPLAGVTAGAGAGFLVGGPVGALLGGVFGLGLGLGTIGEDLEGIADTLSIDLGDAKAELDAAKADLRGATNGRGRNGPGGIAKALPKYPTLPQLEASLIGAKGAFSVPMAAQQFGLYDKQQDKLDTLVTEVQGLKTIVRDALKFQ